MSSSAFPVRNGPILNACICSRSVSIFFQDPLFLTPDLVFFFFFSASDKSLKILFPMASPFTLLRLPLISAFPHSSRTPHVPGFRIGPLFFLPPSALENFCAEEVASPSPYSFAAVLFKCSAPPHRPFTLLIRRGKTVRLLSLHSLLPPGGLFFSSRSRFEPPPGLPILESAILRPFLFPLSCN